MIHTPMNPDQPEEPEYTKDDRKKIKAELKALEPEARRLMRPSWLPIIQNWLSLRPADRMAYRDRAEWEKLPIEFQTWSQEKRAAYLDEHHPLEEKL